MSRDRWELCRETRHSRGTGEVGAAMGSAARRPLRLHLSCLDGWRYLHHLASKLTNRHRCDLFRKGIALDRGQNVCPLDEVNALVGLHVVPSIVDGIRTEVQEGKHSIAHLSPFPLWRNELKRLNDKGRILANRPKERLIHPDRHLEVFDLFTRRSFCRS